MNQTNNNQIPFNPFSQAFRSNYSTDNDIIMEEPKDDKPKIFTPSLKSFLNIENLNLFFNKEIPNRSNSNNSTFFTVMKPENKKDVKPENPKDLSNDINSNRKANLNSNSKNDEDFIEMKDECTISNDSGIINKSISNISGIMNQSNSSRSFVEISSFASELINFDKKLLYAARYKVTQIEKLLNVQYEYNKTRKNRAKQTIRTTSFFITFIDHYNSLLQYFTIFLYLRKVAKGFNYLICVKDNDTDSNELVKFHIYVQYVKGAELNFEKLNTKDVCNLGTSAKKIVPIMKEYGILLDEIGEGKNKGPYVLDLNKMMEDDEQRLIDLNKRNSSFNVYNFQSKYFIEYKKVDYFYGINIEYFNDILMSYLKGVKNKFDIIFYIDGLWRGFNGEKSTIAVMPYFSDKEILLEDFIKLISFNKGMDIFKTDRGEIKNYYNRIIIVTEIPPERLYRNYDRPTFIEIFQFYNLDRIKNEQEIHIVLNLMLNSLNL